MNDLTQIQPDEDFIDSDKLNFDLENPTTWLGAVLEIDEVSYQIDTETVEEWLNDENEYDVTLVRLEDNERVPFHQDEFYDYLNDEYIVSVEAPVEGTPNNDELDGNDLMDRIDEEAQ